MSDSCERDCGYADRCHYPNCAIGEIARALPAIDIDAPFTPEMISDLLEMTKGYHQQHLRAMKSALPCPAKGCGADQVQLLSYVQNVCEWRCRVCRNRWSTMLARE